jgi:hypothetical protein
MVVGVAVVVLVEGASELLRPARTTVAAAASMPRTEVRFTCVCSSVYLRR